MPPPSAVLVLDIDGTITTAYESDLLALRHEARRNGVPIYINTARDASYCDGSKSSMGESRAFAPAENHHCLVHAYPPASKVANMHKIQLATGTPRARIMLVDDRPENIRAVRMAGYAGHLVCPEQGITACDARQIMRALGNVGTRRAHRPLLALLAFVAACATLSLITWAKPEPSQRDRLSKSGPPTW